MKIYVGADWSAIEVVCSVAVEDGPVRRIKGARRDLSSVTELLSRVRALAVGAEVHVVIEAGAPGWVEIFHHAGAVVHIVDPKRAKRFAESRSSSGAKDDGRDGDHLVAIGRSPDHAPEAWKPPSERQEQLDVLGGLHEMLTAEQGAACQRLRGVLREAFPPLEALFDDIKRAWVLAFLQLVPTAWHTSCVSDAELTEVLKGATKAMRERVRTVLQAGHAPWLTEARARIDALRVRQLIAQIELFSRQLADVEKQVDTLTEDLTFRRQVDGVPGIGLNMAHRLLQFAFDETPTDRDQAAVRMGACPVFRGSGKTTKGKPKGKAVLRRAAPPRARSGVYLLGRLVSQRLDWAKRMYADGRRRGQSAGTAYGGSLAACSGSSPRWCARARPTTTRATSPR